MSGQHNATCVMSHTHPIDRLPSKASVKRTGCRDLELDFERDLRYIASIAQRTRHVGKAVLVNTVRVRTGLAIAGGAVAAFAAASLHVWLARFAPLLKAAANLYRH